MAFAVIRVRGHKKINKDIEDTMSMLRLTRVNHCVVIPENAVMKGMLQKSKDFITWGEVSEETLTKMIQIRGKLMGDKPIDDEYVSQNSDFSSIEEFAKSVVNDEVKYASLKDVKPIFRLHPPRQGYEAIKKDIKTHGSLGYRGNAINALIEKML
ncbi:50S ribosomal protein L30 [Candidatus Methanomassiliicoccus intestinalis]|uniref:50S ribosomal protein L30 n=1 Tax=Candidatus Methanomassiliicoccus intestinalis TaxID=1406512 RepID=UPI0037DCE321